MYFTPFFFLQHHFVSENLDIAYPIFDSGMKACKRILFMNAQRKQTYIHTYIPDIKPGGKEILYIFFVHHL